ncbi:MAG: hypothetical protein KKA90_00065 [Nanoarchaeota archaeon]|nr:hypothetical protein [Nanoarchaeota archaeon]
MAHRGYYKNTKDNAVRIFRALKKAHGEGREFLTIGEISREAGLHKWIVSRTVDIWMHGLVEVASPGELDAVGLKIKLVRLRNLDLNEDQVLTSLAFREKLETPTIGDGEEDIEPEPA